MSNTGKAVIEFFSPTVPTRTVWTGVVDMENLTIPEVRQQFLTDTLFHTAFAWASEQWADHRNAKWEYVRQEGMQPDMVNVFDGGRWIGTFKLVG